MWGHSVHMSIDITHAWVPTDTFGTRLVLVRRELGLTVKEAADRCGLHYATWSTWENGRNPANMAAVVRAITRGLGVSREWLMWGYTPESPRPDTPDEGSEGGRATRRYPNRVLQPAA